jgi:histone-lysine N-methyltransferase SETMAR
MQTDAQLTVREIADRTGVAKMTVHDIMVRDLGLSKLSARWVPRLLTPEMKSQRLSVAQCNIRLVRRLGGWKHVRTLVISGDETWIPFFDPETKEENRI